MRALRDGSEKHSLSCRLTGGGRVIRTLTPLLGGQIYYDHPGFSSASGSGKGKTEAWTRDYRPDDVTETTAALCARLTQSRTSIQYL
jgi:hypothetical protein